MKFLSVCSGIEAASVAWHDLGFECVGVSEIDKFPSEVLKYHYPSIPNLGDMTRFKEWNDDLAFDLLVGGTPCQSFSVAGLRKGMDDPRGNLALTYVAIAEKYKPKWFVWENVPGVLSSNGGKDFASFLSAMADIGYGIAYRVLDAQFFGVPQRRRRVFVVGYLGDYRPATAVLFEPSSVFGHTPKGRKKGKGTTASAETSPRANGTQAIPYDLYQITAPINKQNREVGDPCHTLARDNTAHASIIEIKESTVFNINTEVRVRKHNLDISSFQKLLKEAKSKSNLTNQEIANILRIPKTQVEHYFRADDSFAIVDSELWIPLKNALGIKDDSFDLAITEFEIKDNAFESAGRIYLSNLAPTLTSAAAGKQSFIVNESCVYENHPTDSRVKPIDVSSTVTSRWGTGGNNVPFVRESQPIILMDQGGSVMSTNESGLVGTLRAETKGHPPIVAENTHATLTTTHGPRQGSSDEGVASVKAIFSNTMRVRRLTPTECERLQGFPDGWTQIPYGKKTKEQCPDGHRYKALGNSMAVPVMRWIGRRIKLFESLKEKG